ncbi:MAG: response regulator [Spirochaetes bacterium]|nr:response regulator [Spirochaetota bacterium]
MNNQIPVMIVDDCPEDCEVLEIAFHKYNFHQPLIFIDNGTDAIDYLKKEGKYKTKNYPLPGMILLDLNLPGIDGRKILKMIKNDSVLKTIPVIIFTSSNEEKDIIKCYELGANSYIQKPIDINELYKIIKTIIDYWFSAVILIS